MSVIVDVRHDEAEEEQDQRIGFRLAPDVTASSAAAVIDQRSQKTKDRC